MSKKKRTPFGEYATGTISAIFLLSLLSFLSYKAIFFDDDHPDFAISVIGTKIVSVGYLVRFKAENTGGRAAAAVVIKGVLESDGKPVEVSTTSIQYVPAHSFRYGGLYFSTDPRNGQLKIYASGHSEP